MEKHETIMGHWSKLVLWRLQDLLNTSIVRQSIVLCTDSRATSRAERTAHLFRFHQLLGAEASAPAAPLLAADESLVCERRTRPVRRGRRRVRLDPDELLARRSEDSQLVC